MDTVKVKVHSSPRTIHDSKRGHSSHTPSSQDTRRQRCAKIQKARDALVNQMRAGFSARQDEKLHERLRKLDNEYYELRCSGT
jgi:ribosome recycling factor